MANTKNSGTLVSRVNYPITLGKGKNSFILPPHGRVKHSEAGLYKGTEGLIVLLDKETK